VCESVRNMPNVILATSGYDHSLKFWEAPSGICYRTIQLNPDSVRCWCGCVVIVFFLLLLLCLCLCLLVVVERLDRIIGGFAIRGVLTFACGSCCNTHQQVNRLEVTPSKEYIAAAGNPFIRFFEANTNNPSPVCCLDCCRQQHMVDEVRAGY
jgi:WD40 repeat protein